MEEEKKTPMDLNGDGEVTLSEKVQYYANLAGEKVEEGVKKVYESVKEDAKDALADAKVMAAKVKEKGKEVYDKAADKAKDLYAEAKVNAAELADKGKAKAAEALDAAKAMIDGIKAKKDDKEA